MLHSEGKTQFSPPVYEGLLVDLCACVYNVCVCTFQVRGATTESRAATVVRRSLYSGKRYERSALVNIMDSGCFKMVLRI